jgi:hypothetical protein
MKFTLGSKSKRTAKSDKGVPNKRLKSSASETKATDGFQTPSKKHQVPATSSKETATAANGRSDCNKQSLSTIDKFGNDEILGNLS